MVTPRTIAILGACSKNGRTAVEKLVTNNKLFLADEDKEQLQNLKDELLLSNANRDVEIMQCFQDTGWEADAIVLATQSAKDKEVFSLMKPYVTGKTVIVFSCGKEDELNALLPYSKIVRINEADLECVSKMQSILDEAL